MEIGPVNSPAAAAAIAQASLTMTREQQQERREIVQAVKALNRAELFGQNNELTFTFDRTYPKPILKIVDRETREVIRQIPPEYVLRLAQEVTRTADK